ncbi:hypothetical protein PPERSA_02219 [Pseudocohnilembus persalinus]|uniref:Uncharacterized protein n=1 Tax=Pseudocohnilembus persalinus TaxID=266149 RepID=A0A0V0QKA1_PSEPJ|nr:hypothetical protein PPERSA_02219 [Pseudocohnilembus persalinus]|eukprot:KRX02729.1 hypothetical protein PPERSA_02219 [Pseudocohnilembus persalinus]
MGSNGDMAKINLNLRSQVYSQQKKFSSDLKVRAINKNIDNVIFGQVLSNTLFYKPKGRQINNNNKTEKSLKNMKKQIVLQSYKEEDHPINQMINEPENKFIPFIYERDAMGRLIKDKYIKNDQKEKDQQQKQQIQQLKNNYDDEQYENQKGISDRNSQFYEQMTATQNSDLNLFKRLKQVEQQNNQENSYIIKENKDSQQILKQKQIERNNYINQVDSSFDRYIIGLEKQKSETIHYVISQNILGKIKDFRKQIKR